MLNENDFEAGRRALWSDGVGSALRYFAFILNFDILLSEEMVLCQPISNDGHKKKTGNKLRSLRLTVRFLGAAVHGSSFHNSHIALAGYEVEGGIETGCCCHGQFLFWNIFWFQSRNMVTFRLEEWRNSKCWLVHGRGDGIKRTNNIDHRVSLISHLLSAGVSTPS